MALEWLTGKSRGRPLEETIEELGEPVVAKALGQVPLPGRSDPVWCLLLLTETSFVILHSETNSWAARLTGKASREGNVRRISLASIESFVVPPKRPWLARLIRGPSVTVSVELKDGSEPIRIASEDRDREFFTSAASLADGRQ